MCEGRPHSLPASPVIWVAAMLVKPSTDAAECLRRATECELQAERAKDSAAKQSFLDLAERWRRIANTFEYIERVDRFISNPKREG